MNHVVLYIIGPPGVGKSTLVRRLLGWDEFGNPPPTLHLNAKPKWTIAGGSRTDLENKTLWSAGGHYSGAVFDGGDTVPYTGADAALSYWIREVFPLYPVTILDGDRFSTTPSLEFIRAHAKVIIEPKLVIVGLHLGASPETLAARRSDRARIAGTAVQNATWVKGRETKSRNFADKLKSLDLHCRSLNAELPIDEQVDHAKALVRVHQS